MPATAVLVHGGWSGSWIWNEVVKRLEERGVPVRAVDLPSCSATTPDVDFRDDAAHVRSVIEDVGGPVVLAGNSYGGIVITEAAVGTDAVKRLVYLPAFMPDADEVLSEFLVPHAFPEFGAGMQVADTGLVSLDIDVKVTRAFAHAPDDRKEFVRAKSGAPMSFGSDPTATVTAASWRTIPSTYVVCTEDLAIKPESERQWAKERATDYVEWPSDHCPHMSRPDDVADLLAKLASDIS